MTDALAHTPDLEVPALSDPPEDKSPHSYSSEDTSPAVPSDPPVGESSNGGEALGGTGETKQAGEGRANGATMGDFGTFTEAGDYVPRTVTLDDLGDTSFEDAVAQTIVEFADGDIVAGTIVRVDRDEVLLDIGFKSEGVIPSRELSIRHDVDPSEVVEVGDQIEALVLQKEDPDGRLVLSKKRAQYERAWGRIEEIRAADGVVKGPVIEVVKGGLIVDIGLRGFLPASLVELRRVRDLTPYVGRELEAKIIELDKNRNNVVLNRRSWLEESLKEQREGFLRDLQRGERRTGRVSSVVSFGAFVDLGGMDGLIHVSELSWKHVDHPSSIVSIDDEVTVEVLEIDRERERISLSLKATQQDPWEVFATSHRVEELVYGRVSKLVPFGAFVQVGDGIEGLVHISEMSAHHVDLPEQVVTPGEELWVKIIDLDLKRRRISLSIKQAAEGGVVAEEYREAFGEHAYDEEGNFIGEFSYETPAEGEESEAERAWREYYEEHGEEAYRQALAHYENQDTADQGAETQGTETQDPETQDPETQDPETQDPDKQVAGDQNTAGQNSGGHNSEGQHAGEAASTQLDG